MGFIESYTEYASEFTDSPPIIHQRVALAILSIAVNRNVFLVQGHKHVYPNLWMVIVAPSSFYRKSYSLSIGEKIIREVDPDLILPREFSHEALLETMSEQSRGLMIFYEFKTFMGMMSRDYMSGAQAMITELFDCPDVYDRRIKGKSGKTVVNEPFLNILSATTIDWMENSLKDDDLAGGFLPRFLIVKAPPKTQSLAFQPESDQTKKFIMIEQLKRIMEFKGKMIFAPDSVEYYADWYNEYEKRYENSSPMLSPFYVRLTEYAKKFAILQQMNDAPGLVISRNSVEEACALADIFAREMGDFVENELSFTFRDKLKKRVSRVIRDSLIVGITRSELMRTTHIPKKDLIVIIDDLLEENRIELINEDKITSQGNKVKLTKYVWIDG